jgi:cytoskeletal protein CcmA (bactofilin family)
MTVAGFFKGEAEVTGKLTILAPARFEGRIRCACLVVEEGAQVNGQVSFLDGRPESPDAGVPAL